MDWKLGGLALLLVFLGCSKREPEKESAIKSCTSFLKSAAKNPSSAEIPSPSEHMVSESGQALIWRHGDGLRFMNGFGAMLDTSAKCFTSQVGVVNELYVDDQKVFDFDGDEQLSPPTSYESADAAADAAAAAALAPPEPPPGQVKADARPRD